MTSESIVPFEISVSDRSLEQLSQKLHLAIISEDQECSSDDSEDEWSHGPPAKDLHRLLERWKSDFDWKTVEKKINSRLCMFQTQISVEGFGELDIHFVHHKSDIKSESAIPLLFIHGCRFN
jgi:microsomal epoxide hydrolase